MKRTAGEIVYSDCFIPSTETHMLRFGQVMVGNVHSLLANEISESSFSIALIAQKVSTNRKRQASFSHNYRVPLFYLVCHESTTMWSVR